MAGWNSEESSGRSVVPNPTPENFAAALERIFGSRASEALAAYGGAEAQDVARAATDLASDQFIAYGTWKWLDEQSRTGAPVYRYYFSRPRPPLATPPSAQANRNAPANPWASIPRGAPHSTEIEYALDNLSRNTVYAWTDDDRKVSATMKGYFVNFIKTHDPNGAGLPMWPRGTPDANGSVMRMRIDVETRAEREPTERYRFLESFYGRQ
jgi:para-nitrobenzyl esterase